MSLANASGARLESDLLRSFLAVAATGSVTAGAERVFRSQSAISLQIRRLEEILGRRVFERRGRGVVLTAYGETLAPVAERVVGLLDAAVADARADGLAGTLRIGVPEEVGEGVLTAVVSRLARDHPRVELSVRSGISAGFPAAVERGDLDAALCDVETLPAGWSLLRRVERRWIASTRHRPQDRTPLPVALFDRACSWRDMAVDALDRSGRDYRVVFTSESTAGILAAVRAGMAVALVGDIDADPEIARVGELPDVDPCNIALALRPGLDRDLGIVIERVVRSAVGDPR